MGYYLVVYVYTKIIYILKKDVCNVGMSASKPPNLSLYTL